MPVLSIATPELETHIYYPIIKQMCHKVLNDLNLTKIVQNHIFIETGFSQPKSYTDKFHNARMSLDKLKVEAEININPQNLKWDNITFNHALEPLGFSYKMKNRDYQTLFYDPTNNIRLHEMHLPTYISLNCTLSIRDRGIAYTIPSMLYRHYPPNMVSNEHISYDYPIPKPTIALLYTLYKLKRFNKPDSFRTWLSMCSGRNTQFSINRVATKEELVTKKILIDSLFSLDFSENKPQEEVVNKTIVSYNINFTIHIQFTRPDIIIMDYPIVLDNQLLPGELIPEEIHKSEPLPNLLGPYPENIINDYLSSTKHVKPVMIKFPDYDTWNMPDNCVLFTRSYRPWFSSIFLMDEDKEYTTLELGGTLDEEYGYKLHPVVKDIILAQGLESFNDDCIFNITVFNDDIPVEKTYLDIDEDLNIYVKCIDPSKTRRIVISEINDLSFLNPKWYSLYEKYQGLIAGHLNKSVIYGRNTNGLSEPLWKQNAEIITKHSS